MKRSHEGSSVAVITESGKVNNELVDLTLDNTDKILQETYAKYTCRKCFRHFDDPDEYESHKKAHDTDIYIVDSDDDDSTVLNCSENIEDVSTSRTESADETDIIAIEEESSETYSMAGNSSTENPKGVVRCKTISSLTKSEGNTEAESNNALANLIQCIDSLLSKDSGNISLVPEINSVSNNAILQKAVDPLALQIPQHSSENSTNQIFYLMPDSTDKVSNIDVLTGAYKFPEVNIENFIDVETCRNTVSIEKKLRCSKSFILPKNTSQPVENVVIGEKLPHLALKKRKKKLAPLSLVNVDDFTVPLAPNMIPKGSENSVYFLVASDGLTANTDTLMLAESCKPYPSTTYKTIYPVNTQRNNDTIFLLPSFAHSSSNTVPDAHKMPTKWKDRSFTVSTPSPPTNTKTVFVTKTTNPIQPKEAVLNNPLPPQSKRRRSDYNLKMVETSQLCQTVNKSKRGRSRSNHHTAVDPLAMENSPSSNVSTLSTTSITNTKGKRLRRHNEPGFFQTIQQLVPVDPQVFCKAPADQNWVPKISNIVSLEPDNADHEVHTSDSITVLTDEIGTLGSGKKVALPASLLPESLTSTNSENDIESALPVSLIIRNAERDPLSFIQ